MAPDSVRLSFTTESGNITEQILNKAQQAFIYEKIYRKMINLQEDTLNVGFLEKLRLIWILLLLL